MLYSNYIHRFAIDPKKVVSRLLYQQDERIGRRFDALLVLELVACLLDGMSFYLDDDDEDQGFSQTLWSSQTHGASSSSSQVEATFAAVTQSQESSLLVGDPSKKKNNNVFVCQNCGAIDRYYRDEVDGGKVTCSLCFTQAPFQSPQEEFEFDDGQNMGLRNAKGILQGMTNYHHKSQQHKGRPKVPLEALDTTKPPPPLDECLRAFGKVLTKACAILCLELMQVFLGVEESSETTPNTRREMHKGISKTVKELWKAYLWSWKEGAEDYSKLYPQIRFCLRDAFLGPSHKRTLYHTLSAKARITLERKVKQEVAAEQETRNDGKNNNYSPDVELYPTQTTNSLLFSHNHKNAAVKVEEEDDDSEKDKAPTSQMDTLIDLFDRSESILHNSEQGRNRKRQRPTSFDDSETETTCDSREDRVPDMILSKTTPRHLHKRSRTPTHHQDLYADNAIGGSNRTGNNHPSRQHINNNNNKDNNEDIQDDESQVSFTKNGKPPVSDLFSVASDLSFLDGNPDTKPSLHSSRRKQKKIRLQEHVEAFTSNNVVTKMLYYHQKKEKGSDKTSKSKQDPKLGRKEAALLLRPSMVLAASILLVASAPYGVTEGQLVKWIENGSLPLLRAFHQLLPKDQQAKLSMVSSFFSLSVAPTPAVLRSTAKKLHVACGYRAPSVKLVKPKNAGTSPPNQTGRILTTKALYAPGRLVRPSAVPHLLGHLVSELGFGQRVLNYALALMGLSVSSEGLLEPSSSSSYYYSDGHHKDERKGRKRRRRKSRSSEAVVPIPSELSERWDIAPVFDLNDPKQLALRNRYRNMIYQRRWKAKQRAGKIFFPRWRNRLSSAYKAIKETPQSSSDHEASSSSEEDESLPSFFSSSSSSSSMEETDSMLEEDSDDEIPSFIEVTGHPEDSKELQGRYQKQIDRTYRKRRKRESERGHLHRNDRNWLPKALKSARIDKLGDVNRILAVVIVACKLIPDWDQDYRYIFHRGQSNSKVPTERFVPWDQNHFGYIANGKTESDYLSFLSEVVFHKNSHVLPKFVESLLLEDKDSSVLKQEKAQESSDLDGASCNGTHATSTEATIEGAVVPNETVLGGTRSRQRRGNTPRGSKDSQSIPYRLTTLSDKRGFWTRDTALAPLIEYVAYKTGTYPEKILDHLIRLDKELKRRAGTQRATANERTKPMTPAKLYKTVMRSNAEQRRTKRKRTPTKFVTPKQRTPAVKRKPRVSKQTLHQTDPDERSTSTSILLGLDRFGDEESMNTHQLLHGDCYSVGETTSGGDQGQSPSNRIIDLSPNRVLQLPFDMDASSVGETAAV